jgi:hypothetical protein
MAKGNQVNVVKERPRKVKSAAQLAKKAANEAKALARLQALQSLQKAANEARALGFVGGDEFVVSQRRLADEKREINLSLCGPSGNVLERWLKGRHLRYPHADVLKLVRRFFAERPQLVRYKQAA